MTTTRTPEYELVPTDATASFLLREFKLPRFASPWHVHPEFDLTHIIAGHGLRFVGDSVTAFHPGDLVLIGANVPHYWRSAAATPQSIAHSRVIQFRIDCLGRDFFERPEFRAVRQLLARARRGIQFHGRIRIATAEQMRSLARQSGPARIATFIAILAGLAQTRQSRALCSAGFLAIEPEGSDRLHRACRHVFAHFHEPLMLKDAARAVALSPAAFCRFFRRATGRRFFNFVNDLRIGHASAQLIETDLTIGAIAAAAGFNSLANFNRRFRERQRLTPSAYRQLHR